MIQNAQGATGYWIVSSNRSQGHLLGQLLKTKNRPVRTYQTYIVTKGYSFEAQQEGETEGDITWHVHTAKFECKTVLCIHTSMPTIIRTLL